MKLDEAAGAGKEGIGGGRTGVGDCTLGLGAKKDEAPPGVEGGGWDWGKVLGNFGIENGGGCIDVGS